ncbi:Myotubularin-like phosphatase domain [Balamuthia mandrillaris]
MSVEAMKAKIIAGGGSKKKIKLPSRPTLSSPSGGASSSAANLASTSLSGSSASLVSNSSTSSSMANLSSSSTGLDAKGKGAAALPPATSVRGNPQFLEAVRAGDKQTLKRLVKKDGRKGVLNFVIDAYGSTTLHAACEEGHTDMVHFMLERYPSVSVNVKDNSGWTPLFCACRKGHLKMCEILLNKGADASILSNDKATPLHYFVREDYPSNAVTKVQRIIRLMVDSGLDLNHQNTNGETALHIAAYNGKETSVKALLLCGALVNRIDRNGETPLHHAARTAHKDIITMLIDQGADRSIMGQSGTPKEVAESLHLDEVTKLLETYIARKDRLLVDDLSKSKQPVEKEIKLVLVGDGKTCCKTQVLKSYLQSNPKMKETEDSSEETGLQVGGEFTVDNKHVRVTILDAPSEDAKRRQAYYTGANLFLLFFSIVDPDSLENVLHKWIPEVCHYQPGAPYILVGTNVHLRTDPTTLKFLRHKQKSPIPQAKAAELAKRVKATRYVECSSGALQQQGVVELFEEHSFRYVASPTTKESKEKDKLRRNLEKVKVEVAIAAESGANHLSLRKKGIDNTHIPNNLGRDLSNLTKVILNENKLFFVPLALLELSKLEVLELRNNAIAWLPPQLPKLGSLTKLDVENNMLRELPREMGTMTRLQELKLRGNTSLLDGSFLPPEALANGTRGILAFLRDLLKGAERCYRMKLMFVGREAAGKTSLSYYLQNDKKMDKAPLSTDGIDINQWNIPFGQLDPALAEKYMKDNWKNDPVTFSVWDFAGQEVYYSTHQFYLSRRSIYIVVFNLMDKNIMAGNFRRVEYWLQSVNAKAKGAPIVVVGTRQDLASQSQVNELFLKMQSQFADFGVKKYIAVSCLTGKGLKALKDGIVELALSQRNMGEQIPVSYLELEKVAFRMKVERQKNRQPPTISWPDFREEVFKNVSGLTNDEELIRAAEFLHELGSLVYFHDVKTGLSDIVILDPQWLTEVMATVVSSKTSLDKGILPHKFLTSHIWKGDKYPAYLHDHLLKLLEKFQISFRMRRKRPVMRVIQDHASSTPNKLSYKVGDKILFLEKAKVGKWWKGVHEGVVGYFNCDHVKESDEEPEYMFEDESLVPCLLPTQPPSDISKEWPEFPEKNVPQIGRRWTFNFLPLPFFSQLIVRMLHFAESVAHWRYGIIAEKNKTLSLTTVNHEEKYLETMVRGPNLLDMISLVEEEIDTLRDWFGVEFTEVTIPCSHCLAEHKSKPYMFTLDECETASSQDQKTVICKGDLKSVAVPLVDLVPDISMTDYKKVPFKDIQLGEVIGEGAFADVYKGTFGGAPVAVKKLKNTKGFKEFRTEVKFMSVIRHENIVLLKGISLNPPCIVTEFMAKGNLHSFLEDENNRMTWDLVLQIAEDVAKGMNFLHTQDPPKIHRDLKSPNVLLDEIGGRIVAKVADFGTSRSLAPTIAGRTVDNPIWLAPEVMNNEEYTEKADCYSYGIVLYEIFTRKFPFGKKTRVQIELAVVDGERPEFPHDCPAQYLQLATSLWDPNPGVRPSFSQVLEKLRAIKSATPLAYRASSSFAVEGTPIKVSEGELIFLESANEQSKSKNEKEKEKEEEEEAKQKTVRCFHKGISFSMPQALLEKECARVNFSEYYNNKYNGKQELEKHAFTEDDEESTTQSKQEGSIREGDDEDDREADIDVDLEDDLDDSESDVEKEAVEFKPYELMYGFHRVLEEPPGTLPHAAKCLDNTPSLMNEYEILLQLDMLCLARNSMKQIYDNHTDLTSGIMEIVPERGKMHNPATNSGGLLLGTVKQIGEEVRQKLQPLSVGQRVIPTCSLSTVPIRVSAVGDGYGDQLVHVKGDAIVFGRYSFVPVPDGLDSEVALLAVDVGRCLAAVPRYLGQKNTVCIVGCGRVGLMALCLVRSLAPTAKILCVDSSADRLEIVNSLKKADKVEKINAMNAQQMIQFLQSNTTDGVGVDLVLNCTTLQGVEASVLTAARPGGAVLFCTYAKLQPDHLTNCSSDVSVVFGGGGVDKAHAHKVFELLRQDSQLLSIFKAFCNKAKPATRPAASSSSSS